MLPPRPLTLADILAGEGALGFFQALASGHITIIDDSGSAEPIVEEEDEAGEGGAL